MRGTHACRPGLVALLLLVGPMTARAEIVNWSYTWSATPDAITADAPGTGTIYLNKKYGGTLAGTVEIDTDDSETHIVAANVTAASTAPTNNPDTFTNKPFTLSLVLTDEEWNITSAPLVFRARLNGKLTGLGKQTVTATFNLADLEQSVRLGNHLYTVTLLRTVDATPPTGTGKGAIGAAVVVTKVPEPATLVLAALAIAMFWASVARRRPVFSF